MRRKRIGCTQQALHKRRRNNIRSNRTRMRMVIREIFVHRRRPQLDELICNVLSVIHKRCRTPDIRNHVFAITRESTGCVATCPRFAGIIRCRTGDDDLGPFRDDGFRGLGEIRDVCLDNDTGGCGACLGSRADAVGLAVVCWDRRTAVVVPELNDNPVAGCGNVGDGCKA